MTLTSKPHLRIRLTRFDSGATVAILTVGPRYGESTDEIWYWVADPAGTMRGHLFNRLGYGVGNRDAEEAQAMRVLDRVLGPLTFRRHPGIKPPRRADEPMSPADRRLRKEVALRLALDARDAYASEIVRLRDRIEQLELQIRDAEGWAEAWQHTAMDLQEAGAGRIGLTQDGQIGVIRDERP